jgi:phage repressor protein C with HTH and peptisase S24 domain
MSDDNQNGIRGLPARLKELIGSDSVSKFAVDVGLGDNLVRKYLLGANPGADKLVQIAKAKRINLVWLATGEGPKGGDDFDNDVDPDPILAHALGLGVTDIPSKPVVDSSFFVLVPHFDLRTSAGLGMDNGDRAEEVSQWNAFRRTFWQREINLPPEECFSMDVAGTSMVPFLTDRHLPIYHREAAISTDAVYVFRYERDLFVKWLDRVPGEGLQVRSESPSVKPWIIPERIEEVDFQVIGRLVFKQLGEKV